MVAIVIAYWRKGTDAAWVADELGLSLALVESIYAVADEEGDRRPNG
jgi:hypothetical protein